MTYLRPFLAAMPWVVGIWLLMIVILEVFG